MEFNYFTREHTKIAKGVAILLMIIHHLFRFPDRINYDYISILSLNGISLEWVISDFGKICVFMFIFLSGYGINSLNKKHICEFSEVRLKIFNMYKNYWIFVFLAIIGKIILSNEHITFMNLITDIFAFTSNLCEEWWFFGYYIVIYLLFFISQKYYLNLNIIRYILFFILFFILDIDFYIWSTMTVDKNLNNLFWKGHVFFNLINGFLLGYMFSDFNIYKKMDDFFSKYYLNNNILKIILILCLIPFRCYIYPMLIIGKRIDFFIAPIFIYLITSILYNSKIKTLMIYIGNHSTNIWLVHSLLIYSDFQKIIFLPKISLFIVIWTTMLCLVISIIVFSASKKLKIL